jgi:beta-glucosidase/6-phospho-beta-glucosidase/beta-galactosidase
MPFVTLWHWTLPLWLRDKGGVASKQFPAYFERYTRHVVGKLHDQVKFCCSDINDTIQVVFRVYDVPVPAGTVSLDAYEGHFNDCMVQVFVEDKIKPVCTAPAHTSVTCESFDPSLWAYGAATATDNCCDPNIATRGFSQV